MLDLFQLLDNFHPYSAEQNGDILRNVSPGGNSCHSVLLDKDESCPTADLSNIGRPSGPACSTGELLNTPRILQGKLDLSFNLLSVQILHSTFQINFASSALQNYVSNAVRLAVCSSTQNSILWLYNRQLLS